MLTSAERDVLRAVARRIAPQPDSHAIDLAARVEAGLTSGEGDGWRFAALPSDQDACRGGLEALEGAARSSHGAGFPELSPEAQDALLQAIAGGGLKTEAGLDAAQLRRWFEDLRADVVRRYVAHPATLARIGYSGIGYGGDGERKQGFHAIGPGERESWEPVPHAGGES